MITAIIGSLGLGLLTAISPCPLATNVAAVSFIGRAAGDGRAVIRRGMGFAIGRTVGLTTLAAAISWGLIEAGTASMGIGRQASLLLGPVLVLTGAVLLGLLPLPFSVNLAAGSEKLAGRGLLGAFILGVLFSLSFCPTSAAIYFGALIPLATAERSAFILPASYALASAAPVLALAFVIAAGGRGLGRIFKGLGRVDRVMRIVAGLVLIVLGARFSLQLNFGLPW